METYRFVVTWCRCRDQAWSWLSSLGSSVAAACLWTIACEVSKIVHQMRYIKIREHFIQWMRGEEIVFSKKIQKKNNNNFWSRIVFSDRMMLDVFMCEQLWNGFGHFWTFVSGFVYPFSNGIRLLQLFNNILDTVVLNLWVTYGIRTGGIKIRGDPILTRTYPRSLFPRTRLRTSPLQASYPRDWWHQSEPRDQSQHGRRTWLESKVYFPFL